MTDDKPDIDDINCTIGADLFPFVTLSADRIIKYLNTAEPIEEVRSRSATPIAACDTLNIPTLALDIARRWDTAPTDQRPLLLTQLWQIFDDDNSPSAEMYLRRGTIYKLMKEFTTLYYRSRKYRNVLANNVKKPH